MRQRDRHEIPGHDYEPRSLLAVAAGPSKAVARASRRTALTLTGATAFVLVLAMGAWACSGGLFPDANMEFGCEPGQAPGVSGCNWHSCTAEQAVNHNLDSTPDCQRQRVEVSGENFENTAPITTVDTVDLYWLDAPFFAAGLGGPGGDGQQLDAELCKNFGVLLQKDVTVGSDGTFGVAHGEASVTVDVPPRDDTYANGVVRPVEAYFGANAVCAVWLHDSDGDGEFDAGEHFTGVGNQYNLWCGDPGTDPLFSAECATG